jgi:hypothetical protein
MHDERPAPGENPGGKKLAHLLDKFLFDTRKQFGMFGQINWNVTDVTPEVVSVFVGSWPRQQSLENVAPKIRDAMLGMLADMVPCPRFRAVFARAGDGGPTAPRSEVALGFYTGSGGQGVSPLILIEENAEAYRRQWRPRLRQAWEAMVAEAQAPGAGA